MALVIGVARRNRATSQPWEGPISPSGKGGGGAAQSGCMTMEERSAALVTPASTKPSELTSPEGLKLCPAVRTHSLLRSVPEDITLLPSDRSKRNQPTASKIG